MHNLPEKGKDLQNLILINPRAEDNPSHLETPTPISCTGILLTILMTPRNPEDEMKIFTEKCSVEINNNGKDYIIG